MIRLFRERQRIARTLNIMYGYDDYYGNQQK